MTTYTYRDWNEGYGEPAGESYGEAEARRRFKARKTITALVGEPDAPDTVVEVSLAGEMVTVMWLDALQRPELTYIWSYEDIDPTWPEGKVLLQQVRVAAYDHDKRLPEGESSYTESYHFKTDGHFTGYRGSRSGEDVERTDGYEPGNLQVEDLPAFGEWEPLLKRER